MLQTIARINEQQLNSALLCLFISFVVAVILNVNISASSACGAKWHCQLLGLGQTNKRPT